MSFFTSKILTLLSEVHGFGGGGGGAPALDFLELGILDLGDLEGSGGGGGGAPALGCLGVDLPATEGLEGGGGGGAPELDFLNIGFLGAGGLDGRGGGGGAEDFFGIIGLTLAGLFGGADGLTEEVDIDFTATGFTDLVSSDAKSPQLTTSILVLKSSTISTNSSSER